MSDTPKSSKAPETSSDVDEFTSEFGQVSISTPTATATPTAPDTSAYETSIREPGNIDVKIKNEKDLISKNDSGKVSEKIKQEDDSDDLDAIKEPGLLLLKIKELQQNLTNRDERLNELQQNLTNRDERINELQQNLTNRDERINELQQNLTNRDEQINELRNTIDDQNAILTELLDELTLANEIVITARNVAITQPPQHFQNESYVLLKLGDYKMKENVKIEIKKNLYYGIRRRNQTVDRAIKTCALVYPESREIFRLKQVPNSKHLHSALREQLPSDTMSGNIIALPSEMTENQLIEAIKQTDSNKPF